MKKNNKKGFTLAELLVVVAIIGVLVAISIPVFTSQLEKSREGVDAANIRSAYAEVMTDAVSGKTDTTRIVTLKQQDEGWQETFDFPTNLTPGTLEPVTGSTTADLAYDATTQCVTCNIKLAPTTTP